MTDQQTPATANTRSQERQDLDIFSKDPKYHGKKINGQPDPDVLVDLPWLPSPDQENGSVYTTLGDFIDGTIKLDALVGHNARYGAKHGAQVTSVAYFWHDFGSAGAQTVTIIRTRDEWTVDGRFRFVVIGPRGYDFWTYTRLIEEYPRNLRVYVVILFPPHRVNVDVDTGSDAGTDQ